MYECLFFKVDGEGEVLVAGDPERKHMALCDKLGGIPYQKKQIEHAVSIFAQFLLCRISSVIYFIFVN